MKPLMVAAPNEAADSQLVAAAREGSDVAFEALFRRYRERITGYVRGMVGDHARAEDIVQDVFVSALRSLRSTDRDVAFKPWVYEIAKNASIDHLRRARRASEVSIDSEDFSPVDEGRISVRVASTDAAYSARERLDALRMAFNDLPEAQREVLVSRELEGLSYDKISSRTGLSRSAVESVLFRARRTLRDGFDDIETGERCQRTQAVMTSMTDGQVGLRQERRVTRHLRDCAACRREAVALGLDDLVFDASSRTRAALSRVAALLPLPAFLRRRWLDAGGALGSAGSSGVADQGASLVGKVAVVLAAATIAGGAGVAVKTGLTRHDAGPKAAQPAGTQALPAPGTPRSSAPSGARSGKANSAGRDRTGANGSGKGHGVSNVQDGGGNRAGGRSGANIPLSALGAAAGSLGRGGSSVGGTVNGTVGGVTKGGGGVVGKTVQGVGGTVKGIGGAVGGGLPSVGGAVGNLGGTTGGAVSGAGRSVSGTVSGLTGSANAITGTVPTSVAPAPALPRPPRLTP